MMSSPNHSTSDLEDAFSSMNILNYTSVSSDYFPVIRKRSLNSLENTTDTYDPTVILHLSIISLFEEYKHFISDPPVLLLHYPGSSDAGMASASIPIGTIDLEIIL
ncbi:hypothetical protein Tco_1429191 [Tanacetum coccineum]